MHILQRSLGGLALAALAMTSASAQENYSTWASYRAITVNTKASGANVAASILNYPVLVRLDSASSDVFAQAGANGASLRFGKANGAPRPYHIESWDATAKKAAIWVLADTVKGNDSVAAFRMYWGKIGAADSSKSAAVFDTAFGYKAVFHLNEPSGNIGNATIDTMTGINTGTTAAPGIAGSARNFGGTNAQNNGEATSLLSRQAIDLGNPAVLGAITGRLTFSSWVRWINIAPTATTNSPTHYRNIIQREGAAPSSETFLRIGHTSGNQNQSQYATGKYAPPDIFAQSPQIASAYPDSAQWVHLTGTADSGATGRVFRLFRNGVQIGVSRTSDTVWTTGTASRWWIGRTTGQNNRYFSGDIDELRVAKGTRDSNFIKLEYETQKPATAAVKVGATVVVNALPLTIAYTSQSMALLAGAPAVPNAPNASGAVDSFTVSPALPGGLVLNKTTGVISGTPAGTSAAANFEITARAGANVARDTVAITVTAATADAGYSTWANHKFLTLRTTTQGAGVAQRVLRFPVLVRLDSSNFNAGFGQTAYGGADLRFTKVGDAIRIPHQIESWDAAAKKAAVWVLVDTVPGNNITNIRMHWGKTGVADSSKGSAVFGAANGFGAVWHMNEASGDILDATANAITGTNNGTTATSGQIGGGRNFAGANAGNNVTTGVQTISVGDPAGLDLGTGRVSLEAWVRWVNIRPTTGNVFWRNIIMRQSGSDELHLRVDGNTPYNYRAGAYIANTDYGPLSAQSASEYGDSAKWVHLAGVYDSVSPTMNTWKLYRNGALVGQGSDGDPSVTDRGTWYIGSWSGTNNRRFWSGDMDEIRISKTHRTAAWVKLSYENQKTGQTLVTLADTLTPPVSLASALLRSEGLGLTARASGNGYLFQVRGVESGSVRLAVIDMAGREVWTRLSSDGSRTFQWNGVAKSGMTVGTGVYAIRLAVLDSKGRTVATRELKLPLMQ
jgi:hypothetical protein